ncbi:MAG: hypothetical protein IPI35_31055 [Deltaproteobacteria bacterium]|nr:hypothetical protein [Deltaproteobacteria bacterium]
MSLSTALASRSEGFFLPVMLLGKSPPQARSPAVLSSSTMMSWDQPGRSPASR